MDWFPVHKEVREEFEELNRIGNFITVADGGASEERAYNVLSEIMVNPSGYASSLFQRTSKKLEFIRSRTGNDQLFYPEITDLVGHTIIHILQFSINNAKILVATSDLKQHINDPHIQEVISEMAECKKILMGLKKISVTQTLSAHIEETLKTVVYLQKRLGSHKGCYIATYVYGDYDAPEVQILRFYRDNILSKSLSGRIFIQLYYWLSPKLITLFYANRIFKYLATAIVNLALRAIK